MFGLGKNKAVVGLDIGSSALKAVELKTVGKGRVTAFAHERFRPTARRWRHHRWRGGGRAISRLFQNKAFKTKEVAASLSGNAVIVKRSTAVMTEAELACRSTGRPNNTSRSTLGCESGLPDSRSRHRPRCHRHAGSAAGRSEEGKDCRLHRRHHAGRPRAGGRRRRRVRPAERLR